MCVCALNELGIIMNNKFEALTLFKGLLLLKSYGFWESIVVGDSIVILEAIIIISFPTSLILSGWSNEFF